MSTTTIAETFDERAGRYDDWALARTEPLPEPARGVLRRVVAVEAELVRQAGRVVGVTLDVARRLGRVTWSGAREAASAGVGFASASSRDVADRGLATRDELDRVIGMVRAAGRAGADRVVEEIQAASAVVSHTRDEPTGEFETWTREQLYDRAQVLGIEGRSSMTKAELIEALRAA